jgi:hypothetical protein
MSFSPAYINLIKPSDKKYFKSLSQNILFARWMITDYCIALSTETESSKASEKGSCQIWNKEIMGEIREQDLSVEDEENHKRWKLCTRNPSRVKNSEEK